MVNIEQLMRLENFFAAEKLDLAYLINSYIEYKEEFELNQVFPFNKYIFQEARKVGYELKRFVGLMKFLRIWRCWIGKGSDE